MWVDGRPGPTTRRPVATSPGRGSWPPETEDRHRATSSPDTRCFRRTARDHGWEVCGTERPEAMSRARALGIGCALGADGVWGARTVRRVEAGSFVLGGLMGLAALPLTAHGSMLGGGGTLVMIARRD